MPEFLNFNIVRVKCGSDIIKVRNLLLQATCGAMNRVLVFTSSPGRSNQALEIRPSDYSPGHPLGH